MIKDSIISPPSMAGFRIGSPPWYDRMDVSELEMTTEAIFSVAPVDPIKGTQRSDAMHNLTFEGAVRLLMIQHDAAAPAADEAVCVAEGFGSGSHMNFVTGKIAVVIRH